MSSVILSTTGGPVAGHPVWHFALVAGAGVLTYFGIKSSEWWRQRARRQTMPSAWVLTLSVFGMTSSAIHAAVCPEHFREWVVYGIFFMCASAAQAAWSVLVMLRPSRGLLITGAVGNVVVVALFLISRTVGIPFGPAAFQPEELNWLGIVATGSEVLLAGMATYLVYGFEARWRPSSARMTAPDVPERRRDPGVVDPAVVRTMATRSHGGRAPAVR